MKVTKKRWKEKGRSGYEGPFARIPHDLQDSENWAQCGGTAIKLLCALVRQFNGRNNGDLCASIKVLSTRGWRSADTLHWSLKELEHFGFIELTRQGGRNLPNLYALTWRPIDECGGKLDRSPTSKASDVWKLPKAAFKRPQKNTSSSPEFGATRYGIRSSRVSQAA
ncbi:hypothetical protein [Luteibacter sp.]|uniref:hypothetical protein n=1 Tax=Luteibacter sp. TaxID=1886636 RepID=UPI003F7ED31B